MGVSLSLARDRARRVHDLTYAVGLHLPAAPTAPVTGQVTIAFTLTDAASPLVIDFRPPADHVGVARLNGRPFTPGTADGHIVLPASMLARGTNTLDLAFTAGNDALNRHADYLYTLFVPARASIVLPCFDQPDLKARWSLALDLPAGWLPVTNTRETERVAAGDRVRVRFDQTEPLPPYLFAFAAGRFDVVSRARDGREFRVVHRETDAATVAANLEPILDLHAHALQWLETYTAEPYAFGTFDIVLIPAFQFSGMEHPGAVYYNASSLLLEPSATRSQQLTRAALIAHETAHMWFGNLVTMRWFDDVWMKEVFANTMAARIVSAAFPDANHDLHFLYQHLPAAYDVDRTAGANPIRQPLDDLDDAGSLYGPIIYRKAPVAMRQLELLMGAEPFRDAVRDYLHEKRFGNADWADLASCLGRRTPIDVGHWSEAWIQQSGRPTIRTDLRLDAGRIARLAFVQRDDRGRHLVWPQRLHVLVATGERLHAFDVSMDGIEVTVPAAVGLPAPAWVLPGGGGAEYGLFELDETTRTFLLMHLPDVPDPLARGAALVALWEEMLEGRVTPARMWSMLLATLGEEPDELNIQHMLDLARILFWRFTGDDDRPVVAPALEEVLERGLHRATAPHLKAAWFAALRAVAIGDEAVAWLARIFRRELAIAGLPLTEADETDLAFDLAVRDPADAVRLLDLARQRIRNDDRRARFDFLRPTVSNEVAVVDRWFAGLGNPEVRRREAWVIDGLRYLHHPLRAQASRRYIRPALDLLAEIHRTGDIFFPKRWADATLSGHRAVETADEVRAFIDALPPDYPVRLRWVLQAAADPLWRAARIQHGERGRPA